MILKSVKLENIRSYISQQIDFPTGSVMLAGDIGSGKSTVLLAIEFALFGIKRKELSGAALLRHGKKTGSVELKFDLEGKEVIIKRILKREKDDVKQEAGFIITDGLKKDATHIEIKTEVLQLLGYPSDLITKSKERAEYHKKEFNDPRIVYEVVEVPAVLGLDKIFMKLRYFLLNTESSWLWRRMLFEERKNYFAYYLGSILKIIFARPAIVKIFRRIDYILVRDFRYQNIFDKYKLRGNAPK